MISTVHLAHPFIRIRYFAASLCAATISLLCFSPLTQSSLQPQKQIVAYINWDMGTSIEAGMDRDLNIVALKPANKSAGPLLDQPKLLRPMPFDQFSDFLINAFKKDGTIRNAPFCLITTAFSNEVNRTQKETLRKKMDQVFSKRFSAAFRGTRVQLKWLQPATMAFQREAEKHHLTLGRYTLYLRARASGNPISVEQARNLSTQQIMELGFSDRTSQSTDSYFHHIFDLRAKNNSFVDKN